MALAPMNRSLYDAHCNVATSHAYPVLICSVHIGILLAMTVGQARHLSAHCPFSSDCP